MQIALESLGFDTKPSFPEKQTFQGAQYINSSWVPEAKTSPKDALSGRGSTKSVYFVFQQLK